MPNIENSGGGIPVSAPKIPVKIYESINEFINLEKNFRNDMADFVRLFENSMDGLNIFEKRKLKKILEVYKELSKGGLLADLKELNENSSPSEVMNAVQLIQSSAQAIFPDLIKRKEAFISASKKFTEVLQYMGNLIKGVTFIRGMGDKFKKDISINYAKYAASYNFDHKNDKQPRSVPSDPLSYLNTILIKPIQNIPKIPLLIKEINEGLQEEKTTWSTECQNLMNQAFEDSKQYGKDFNAASKKVSGPKPKEMPEIQITTSPEQKPQLETKKSVPKIEVPVPPKEEKENLKKDKKQPSQKFKFSLSSRSVEKKKSKRAVAESHRKHSSQHLQFAHPSQNELPKPAVKATVELIGEIINQKYPRSKFTIIKEIRKVIESTGDNEAKLIAIQNKITQEKRVNPRGYAMNKEQAGLRAILQEIGSGRRERIERVLEGIQAERKSQRKK